MHNFFIFNSSFLYYLLIEILKRKLRCCFLEIAHPCGLNLNLIRKITRSVENPECLIFHFDIYFFEFSVNLVFFR